MLKKDYKRFAYLLVVVFLALIAWCSYLGWHTYQLYQIYQQVQSIANEARQGQFKPDEAARLLQTARQNLIALRTGLGPLLPILRKSTGAPGQVEPGIDYAIHLTSAGDHLLAAAKPAWEILQEPDGGDNTLAQALQSLSAHQADLDAAVESMEAAAAVRQQIDFDQLPPSLSKKIAPYDRLFPQARAAVIALAHLPILAGAGEEQSYLVAAQNNDELRATGGFISAAGIARVHQGKITHLNLSDSYMLDNPDAEYPDPPEPLQHFMDAGVWLLRDANWSPDLPTSARQMEALYELSIGETVDGVVIFDQTALVQVLGALGPVQVEGFRELVDAKNVLQWMHEAWAPEAGQAMDLDWWTRRKEFMQDLGQAVVTRLVSARDPQLIEAIARTLLKSAQQGHLLVYFHSDSLQSAIQALGLDGGVHPGPADYLFLVDSNIGFNKTDAVIRRSLAYRVDLSDPGEGRAALQVTYEHPDKTEVACVHQAVYGDTYKDLMARCYWNYWRVLTAPGSRLLKASTLPVPGTSFLSQQGWDGTVRQETGEGGTVQFSGVMVLPTASKASWQIEWMLPANVLWQQEESSFYQLKLQKQPGIVGYTLRIEIIPPTGLDIVHPPAGWQISDSNSRVWVWQGTIDQTTTFMLEFRTKS